MAGLFYFGSSVVDKTTALLRLGLQGGGSAGGSGRAGFAGPRPGPGALRYSFVDHSPVPIGRPRGLMINIQLVFFIWLLTG